MSTKLEISGRAWVVGDDVHTDMILPDTYLSLDTPAEMARHIFEGEPGLVALLDQVQPGDVLVAGANFGCGGSHEQPLEALREAGISAIVAESFSHFSSRNAINMGYPILECPGITGSVETGDTIVMDVRKGIILNQTRNAELEGKPLEGVKLEILAAGGLFEWQRLQDAGE